VDHDLLIQHIYDAAESPAGLPDALPHIGRILEADKGHTLVIEGGVNLVGHHSYGYDLAAFASYDVDWRASDPRFVAAVARPNEVLSDVAVVKSDTFERSAIYNDFLATVGVRYTLFATVEAAPDLLMAQAFMRPKGAEPFGPEEVRRLTALMPHLTRAIRLRHLFTSLSGQVEDLGSALDTMPAAIAVLDRYGKVLCTNAAADAILARADGLLKKRSGLTAMRSTEARALAAAIAAAASLADAGNVRPPAAHAAPAVAITRGSGLPLSVVLLPLRSRNPIRGQLSREARVLAVLHDPERLVTLDAALVAQLHGLTPTEAALAVAIAKGQSLTDFAEERGCTEMTAKTHVKRILSKTGTTRQVDLVRVLLTGAAMHQVR